MAKEHKELKGLHYKLILASEDKGCFSCTGCIFDSKTANDNGITCFLIKKDKRYNGFSLGCTRVDTEGDSVFYIFAHNVSKLLKEL